MLSESVNEWSLCKIYSLKYFFKKGGGQKICSVMKIMQVNVLILTKIKVTRKIDKNS